MDITVFDTSDVKKHKENRATMNREYAIRMKKDADMKKLGNRFADLKSEFAMLKHYWRVRCSERRTLSAEVKKIKAMYENLKKTEEVLSKSFNRKSITIRPRGRNKSNEPYYIVYLTQNDALRLRLLLKLKGRKAKRIVSPKEGYANVQLKLWDIQKLKALLNKTSSSIVNRNISK